MYCIDMARLAVHAALREMQKTHVLVEKEEYGFMQAKIDAYTPKGPDIGPVLG